jgi:hypothetical protein
MVRDSRTDVTERINIRSGRNSSRLAFPGFAASMRAMKIAAALLALLTVSAQAELKWESPQQRFTYEPGKPDFRGEFAFVNKGKTPVRITKIKSGCTCCTSAKAKKMTIAPGERGVIAVKVDVRGKEVPIAKPVLVETDDGKIVSLIVHVDTKDGKSRMVPRWGK